MLSLEEIVAILRARQRDAHPLLSRMIDVRDRYNGPQVDYVVPYYSDRDQEDIDPLTPMIMAEMIDHVAMRAASVTPATFVPAVTWGKQTGVRSREYAGIRRTALTHTYRESRWELVQRRAARHLAAYATTALVVVPDYRMEMPRIRLRDPLTSYPDIQAAEDYDLPTNAGFIFGKSADWLRDRYPVCRAEYGGPVDVPRGEDELWDCFEWIDTDQTMIGILGKRGDQYSRAGEAYSASKYLQLGWWPNKTGMFPGVVPARVTLDRVLSQVANVIGHVDMMAKMTTLSVIAAERSVFPDAYILGRSGQTPTILGGQWKDGREGQPNVVFNADGVGRLPNTPDPAALQMVDRIERNLRISTGLVPQAGGETYGALRTGRGIDALMGAAVDPRIHELHAIFEAWLPHLNSVVLQTWKSCWGSRTFSMYSGSGGTMRSVQFTPNEHVETLDNVVRYAIPGADVVETNVILQQMVGSGMASRRSARNRHPWIDDADTENGLIDEERLEELAFQSLAAGVQSGSIPPIFLSFVEEHRRKNPELDILQAIKRADEQMREMQAQPVEAPEDPMAAMPPEAMPGMTGPPQAPVAEPTMGPTPDQGGLRELMNAIAASNRSPSGIQR
jgi:hypothetical protein